MEKNWTIRHHKGDTLVEEFEAPGQLSENRIAVLLERLAARHLDAAELVAGILPREDPGYRWDCEVQKNLDSRTPSLSSSCSDHRYTATRSFN
jgi:hypothetical protein